jgi:hypothetical protein
VRSLRNFQTRHSTPLFGQAADPRPLSPCAGGLPNRSASLTGFGNSQASLRPWGSRRPKPVRQRAKPFGIRLGRAETDAHWQFPSQDYALPSCLRLRAWGINARWDFRPPPLRCRFRPATPKSSRCATVSETPNRRSEIRLCQVACKAKGQATRQFRPLARRVFGNNLFGLFSGPFPQVLNSALVVGFRPH